MSKGTWSSSNGSSGAWETAGAAAGAGCAGSLWVLVVPAIFVLMILANVCDNGCTEVTCRIFPDIRKYASEETINAIQPGDILIITSEDACLYACNNRYLVGMYNPIGAVAKGELLYCDAWPEGDAIPGFVVTDKRVHGYIPKSKLMKTDQRFELSKGK